jgi:hypothetical protein
MEAIFKLFDQTKDPNFIGQDTVARDILDHSSIFN